MFNKGDRLDEVLSVLIKPLEEVFKKKLASYEKLSNKLTGYTEVETDEQYYSAKAVNEMFTDIGETLETVFDGFATKDYVNEVIGGIENGSY